MGIFKKNLKIIGLNVNFSKLDGMQQNILQKLFYLEILKNKNEMKEMKIESRR